MTPLLAEILKVHGAAVRRLAGPEVVIPTASPDPAAEGSEPAQQHGGGVGSYDWTTGEPCPHGRINEDAAWCIECEDEMLAARKVKP